MGIFAKTIYAIFHIVSNFTDFHHRKTSVGKAHLLNCYFLLSFFPENTAWHCSEPMVRRSKYNKALFILQKKSFSVVFRNFSDFYLHKASVGRTHLPNSYFLLSFCPENTACHFSEPRSTRSKCYKPLFPLLGPQFFAFFRDSTIFTCAGPLLLCFCPVYTALHFSNPRLRRSKS